MLNSVEKNMLLTIFWSVLFFYVFKILTLLGIGEPGIRMCTRACNCLSEVINHGNGNF